MAEMILPQFGMGMADGTIITWHKAIGDVVEQGEPMCDVEAAKATVEVVAPCSGVLQAILVPSGANVPVNTVIAMIADAAAPAPAPERTSPASLSLSAPSPPPPAPVKHILPKRNERTDRTGMSPQVEPRARRAARMHSLDLSLIMGSGPGGRIVEEDVLRARDMAKQAQSSATEARPQAQAFSASAAFHQIRKRCDARAVSTLLKGIAEARGQDLSPMAVLIRASALALVGAGLSRPDIGVRTEEGSIMVMVDPASLSVRAVEAQFAAIDQGGAAALILESVSQMGLDYVRLDPNGPPSLSVSMAAARSNDEQMEWHLVLSFADSAMAVKTAKYAVERLCGLLEQPLEIFA